MIIYGLEYDPTVLKTLCRALHGIESIYLDLMSFENKSKFIQRCRSHGLRRLDMILFMDLNKVL